MSTQLAFTGWPTRICIALRHLAFGLLVVTAVAALVLALPVLIVLLSMDQAITRRRQLAVLTSTGCIACGSPLNPDALDVADKVWRSEHVELPGMRLRRMIRRLHAICPACGARYEWDGTQRQFQRLDPEPL